MNLNDLAKQITLEESGKREVSIAQVKEIMKIIFEKLTELEPLELFKLLERYK